MGNPYVSLSLLDPDDDEEIAPPLKGNPTKTEGTENSVPEPLPCLSQSISPAATPSR